MLGLELKRQAKLDRVMDFARLRYVEASLGLIDGLYIIRRSNSVMSNGLCFRYSFREAELGDTRLVLYAIGNSNFCSNSPFRPRRHSRVRGKTPQTKGIVKP